jgi:hypothetical protein
MFWASKLWDQVSVLKAASDFVALLQIQALGSVYVAFYDSQRCSEGEKMLFN